MSPLLLVCLALSTLFAALGLHDLQEWLEHWDYDRHAQE